MESRKTISNVTNSREMLLNVFATMSNEMILYILMGFLFMIGLLLVVISFQVYNKLTSSCTSSQLRLNLRIAIGIGSTIMALTLGYGICMKNCNCVIGSVGDYKTYVLLGFMFILGICLSVLTGSIKNISNECNINIGCLTTNLYWISVIQTVIIGFVIVYYIYKVIKDKQGGLSVGSLFKRSSTSSSSDSSSNSSSNSSSVSSSGSSSSNSSSSI